MRQERQRIKLLDLSTYTSSDIKLYLVIEFLTAKPLQYKIMPVSLKNEIDEAVKINFIKFLNLNAHLFVICDEKHFCSIAKYSVCT